MNSTRGPSFGASASAAADTVTQDALYAPHAVGQLALASLEVQVIEELGPVPGGQVGRDTEDGLSEILPPVLRPAVELLKDIEGKMKRKAQGEWLGAQDSRPQASVFLTLHPVPCTF